MDLILHCWWEGWFHPFMIAHYPCSLAHQSVQKRLITSFGGISSVVDCASKKVTVVVVKRQIVGRAGTISFSGNADLSQITMVISLLAWIAHVCSNQQVFFGRVSLVSSVACHLLTPFEMILLKISIDLFTVLGKYVISFLSNCQNVRNKPASWEITLCLFPYFGEWSCTTRFCNITVIQLDKKTVQVGVEAAGGTASWIVLSKLFFPNSSYYRPEKLQWASLQSGFWLQNQDWSWRNPNSSG